MRQDVLNVLEISKCAFGSSFCKCKGYQLGNVLDRHYLDNVKKAYAAETGQEDEPMTAAEIVEQAAQVVENVSLQANLSQAEQLLRAASAEQKASDAYVRLQGGVIVAERKVASLVHLVVDSGSDEMKLGKDLKDSPAAAVRGSSDDQQFVAIIVDAKVLCESGSQAKYRLPPTRSAQVKRLLGAYLSTRDDGDLDEADILVGLDGSKGNDWEEKSLIKILPGKKYHVVKHTVIYSHSSVEKRMERASKTPLELTENLSFIACAGPLQAKVGAVGFG